MSKEIIVLTNKDNVLQLGILAQSDYPTPYPSVGDMLPIHGITFFTTRDLITYQRGRICITVFDGLYEVLKVSKGSGNELLGDCPEALLSFHDECTGFTLTLKKNRDLIDADIDFALDPEVTILLC